MLDEPKPRSLRGLREQRHTAAQQHGDDRDLHSVDQPELEQAAEQ
jgi:hypothetical protein